MIRRSARLPCSLDSQFDYRQGHSMLIPFYRFPLHSDGVAFPLEEVIVGPTPDPQRSVESVKRFLTSHHYENVEVTCSTVPYRDW